MNLPPVLALDTSQESVTLTLEIPPQLEAFAGHFPGHPILPGVVQIDWAMRFAALHLGITARSARDFQVKFRKTICPHDVISLVLQLDGHKNQLLFKYKSGDNVLSSGQLKLGARK